MRNACLALRSLAPHPCARLRRVPAARLPRSPPPPSTNPPPLSSLAHLSIRPAPQLPRRIRRDRTRGSRLAQRGAAVDAACVRLSRKRLRWRRVSEGRGARARARPRGGVRGRIAVARGGGGGARGRGVCEPRGGEESTGRRRAGRASERAPGVSICFCSSCALCASPATRPCPDTNSALPTSPSPSLLPRRCGRSIATPPGPRILTRAPAVPAALRTRTRTGTRMHRTCSRAATTLRRTYLRTRTRTRTRTRRRSCRRTWRRTATLSPLRRAPSGRGSAAVRTLPFLSASRARLSRQVHFRLPCCLDPYSLTALLSPGPPRTRPLADLRIRGAARVAPCRCASLRRRARRRRKGQRSLAPGRL